MLIRKEKGIPAAISRKNIADTYFETAKEGNEWSNNNKL
jgi:hypothetical protein